jgi:hypothetical protein
MWKNALVAVYVLKPVRTELFDEKNNCVVVYAGKRTFYCHRVCESEQGCVFDR